MGALLLALLAAAPLHAGALENLERAVSTPAPAGERFAELSNADGECGGSVTACLVTVFVETFLNAMLSGDAAAVDGLGGGHPGGRAHGLLDLGYQRLDGNVDGAALAGELGWGPYVLAGEYLRYWEYDPADRLDSLTVEARLRLPAKAIWVDLAAGYRALRRDVTSDGAQSGVSVHLLLTEHLRLVGDFRWVTLNGNLLGDHRGRLYLSPWGGRGPGLRAGYRGLRAEGNTLGGPEAGVFWQF